MGKSVWHKEGTRWVHISGVILHRIQRPEDNDYGRAGEIYWATEDDVWRYLSDAKRAIEASLV